MRIIGVMTLAMVGFLALSTTFTSIASAQSLQVQFQSEQYLIISNAQPFTPEANFMSLPGYLRYLFYQQTGQWM